MTVNGVNTPTDTRGWSQSLAYDLSPTNTVLHCRESQNFEMGISELSMVSLQHSLSHLYKGQWDIFV